MGRQSVGGSNRIKRPRKNEFSLSLLELGSPSLPALRHQSSWLLDFGLQDLHLLPYATRFLGSLHVDVRLWDFLAFVTARANSFNLRILSSMCSTASVSLENPDRHRLPGSQASLWIELRVAPGHISNMLTESQAVAAAPVRPRAGHGSLPSPSGPGVLHYPL